MIDKVIMHKPRLTHLDEQGRANMVDVGSKTATRREAVAQAHVTMRADTLRAITDGHLPKGEALSTARLAGIMAAKQCGQLIPLCHPLALEKVTVDFKLPDEPASGDQARILITATAAITAKTGVEMEALTAVSIAALTIYDMCKAIDKTMTITDIRLLHKSK